MKLIFYCYFLWLKWPETALYLREILVQCWWSCFHLNQRVDNSLEYVVERDINNDDELDIDLMSLMGMSDSDLLEQVLPDPGGEDGE